MIASSNQNLTRIHQWSSMPYNERSLLHVFDDIKTRCSKYRRSGTTLEKRSYIRHVRPI